MKSILIILLFITFSLVNFSQSTDNDNNINQIPVQDLRRIQQDKGIEYLTETYFTKDLYILNNRSEDELIYMGYLFLYKDNLKAREIFEFALEKHPKSEKILHALSKIELADKNYDKSINYLDQASLLTDIPLFQNIPFLYSQDYEPTVISENTEDLFVSNDKWESDTALIFVQGGPDFKLRIKEEHDPISEIDKDILKVYPQRATILNPSIFNASPALTEEQAAYEIGVSSDILKQTVSYLESKQKSIFIICHSQGTAICSEYLSKNETPAKKVFLLGNQLDNKHEKELHANAEPGEFLRWRNGKTPHYTKFWPFPKEFPMYDDYNRVLKNIMSLFSIANNKNYSELIPKSNYNKMTMIYSEWDYAAGNVSSEEKNFLTKVGIEYHELNESHQGLVSKKIMMEIWNHISTNAPLDFERNEINTIFPKAYKIALEAIEINQDIILETGGIKEYDIPVSSSGHESVGFKYVTYEVKIIGKERDMEVEAYLIMDPGSDWRLMEINY